jgi:metal-responsive CopG/Arc/MetJ family transcriptional regulator
MAGKRTATSIWITEELNEKLSAYCAKHAANRSEIIRRAIEKYLKENA